MISYKNNILNKNLLYSPESFTLYFSFSTNNNTFQITNNNLNQGQTLDKVQSIMIDNTLSSEPTTIKVEKTGQYIIASPYSIVILPIMMAQNDLITINNMSTNTTNVIIILTDRILSAGQYVTGGI